MPHHRFTLFACLFALTVAWPGLLPGQVDMVDRAAVIQEYFSSGLYFRASKAPPTARSAARAGVDFLRYRTYDGTMNNLVYEDWGKADSKLFRYCQQAYGDGRSVPSREHHLSAREISNMIFKQEADELNSRQLTNMVWQWGQFLDHDLDLTGSKLPLEPLPISVPQGDPWFDPFSTGTVEISFFRSLYASRTGWINARQQMNEITAWIDGSNVYGSDTDTANSLRAFTGGQLASSDGFGGRYLPRGDDGFFLAGDVRANEQICLTCMHTLFMREHNRIADEIATRFPRMDDESVFQEARRRVIGHLQAITYNEFLPALLGDAAVPAYQGYDEQVYPGVKNVFSTAAYRFGHSMLSEELMRLNNDGFPIRQGSISLADAFFNPALLDGLGIDPYLKGLVHQQAQEVDTHLVNAVRNFLFGPPGAGGFDLAALNIQRGRDHGLPDYNTVRAAYGLPVVTTFSQITSDVDLQSRLETAYGSVDEIDPWVGVLSEDHLPGSSLGVTGVTVLSDQFQRLRDGDRFWYQRDLSGSLLQEIEQTTLADIILRNSGVTNIPDNVFVAE